MQIEFQKLTLDDAKVSRREMERFETEPVAAPFPIKAAYHTLCFLLDVVYEGRPLQRFWVRPLNHESDEHMSDLPGDKVTLHQFLFRACNAVFDEASKGLGYIAADMPLACKHGTLQYKSRSSLPTGTVILLVTLMRKFGDLTGLESWSTFWSSLLLHALNTTI